MAAMNDLAKNVALEAVNTILFDGKTIMQWIEEIKATRWISVNERLPKDGKKILVVNGHGYIGISALWRKDGSQWTWIDSNGRFNHVNDITHWMPLPEPPKEES